MWKIITDETFLNQSKIFAAAQPSVLTIVRNARQYPEIKRIIAFGSCVESRFSPISDIDIFVEQDVEKRFRLSKGVQRGVDYWTPFNCDDMLLKEIQTKGVLVYER